MDVGNIIYGILLTMCNRISTDLTAKCLAFFGRQSFCLKHANLIQPEKELGMVEDSFA